MKLDATKVELADIETLRGLFLQEANFQIRYNACHERGWTDSYLLRVDGQAVGYGSIRGRDDIADRDTVFECFVIPPHRKHASRLFRKLLSASGARYIECQSNDLFLSSLLFEHGTGISADTILFEDHHVTEHVVPGAVVRPRRPDDKVFDHSSEPPGDYVLELDGEIRATGGFLRHYNMPFADVYMEVRADSRRRGLGTLIVQEVKKACYLAGRVPAARCRLTNVASRSTLLRAGMRICGFILIGRVK